MKRIIVIMIGITTVHIQCMQQPFQEEFNAIEKIYAIAKKVASEQRAKGTIVDIAETCPDPNPFTYLTKQGIYVMVGQYPTVLVTPFGKIPLFKTDSQIENGDKLKNLKDIILTQEFMQYFKIGFVRNIGEESVASESILHKVSHTIFFDLTKPDKQISKHELNQLRGTSKLIRSNCNHCVSLYEIKKIEEQSLPRLKEYERRRTYNEATTLYENLKK